jgi:hypothetical protein
LNPAGQEDNPVPNEHEIKYDKNAAIKSLNSHAYSESGPNKYGTGSCSPKVPNAINEGLKNYKIPNNLAGSAYGPSLIRAGFKKLENISLKTYTPELGDIAVMNGPSSGKKCNTGVGGPCGHIQMFNGSKWVSDFFQTRPFWPGPDYAKEKPIFKIYRWN